MVKTIWCAPSNPLLAVLPVRMDQASMESVIDKWWQNISQQRDQVLTCGYKYKGLNRENRYWFVRVATDEPRHNVIYLLGIDTAKGIR